MPRNPIEDYCYLDFSQPILGCCDWLSWSVRNCSFEGFDVEAPTHVRHNGIDYTVVPATGTATYSRRFMVFLADDGRKVFTILGLPKSSLFDPTSGLMEVANEWLYHDGAVQRIWTLCTHLFSCTRYGISRFDYCFDFQPTQRQRCIMQMLADGRAYVAGKRSGTSWWSIHTDGVPARYRGHRLPHCISWGHKTSAVRWKLYYKSLELGEPSHWAAFEKPYIVDRWRQAGFDPTDVWRLEVSIHHGNGMAVDGIDALPIDMDAQTMHRIGCSLVSSRFVIRRQQHHSDRRNDRVLHLWDSQFARVVTTKRTDGERQTDELHSLARKLVQSIQQPSIATVERIREGVAWLLAEIAEVSHSDHYIDALTDDTFADLIERLRCEYTQPASWVTDQRGS